MHQIIILFLKANKMYISEDQRINQRIPMGPVVVPMGAQMVPQAMPGALPFSSMFGQGVVMSNHPLDDLAMATSCKINQRFDFLEAFTCCENRSVFDIVAVDGNGVYKYLFKAKEESDWCIRNCCPSNARSFKMNIYHVVYGPYGETAKRLFAQFDRPWTCTFYCLGRPVIHGNYIDNSQPIGMTREPCTICSPEFTVSDKTGKIKYILELDCCQAGFCIGRCYEAIINVIDANTRQIVGSIIKKESCEECFGDFSQYNVLFPPNASPEDKMSLIGSVLFIDYRYFESNPGNNNHRTGYYR